MVNVLGYSLNITTALLNALQELYPDKLPIEQVTSEELAFLRGQQSVVRKLKDIYNEDYGE
jgi:hypothetical protein